MSNQIPKTLIIGIATTVVVLAIIYILTSLPKGGQGTEGTLPVVQPSVYEGT